MIVGVRLLVGIGFILRMYVGKVVVIVDVVVEVDVIINTRCRNSSGIVVAVEVEVLVVALNSLTSCRYRYE